MTTSVSNSDASLVSRLAAIPGGVAVLCGGPGGEREVSLASGENAHKALERAGLPNRLVIAPEDGAAEYLSNLECGLAVMMFHGEFGEGGVVQEILERRGIPFSGSDSTSCRLSIDKNATKKKMVAAGVPTPRWALIVSVESAARAVEEAGLGYPLFVKPNFGGSSVFVSKVETPDALEAAVALALSSDRLALVEEMVHGRELTIGWLEGRTLPVIEMNADGVFYDYRAKYQSDATRYTCPALLELEVEKAIHRYACVVAEIVGARDVARVDVMLGPDGPKFLELNALPGFTSHSLLPLAAATAGIPVERLCLTLAAMAAGRAGVTRR